MVMSTLGYGWIIAYAAGMNALDRLPYSALIVFAILFAIIPLGKPHLFEKIGMLLNGTLRRPLDWFDLFLHSAPLILLIIKAIRDFSRRG